LGCTHYPFVKDQIQEIAGDKVHLIDTGQAVAKQVHTRLLQVDLLNPMTTQGKLNFYSNSAQQNAEEVISRLWGEHVKVQTLDV